MRELFLDTLVLSAAGTAVYGMLKLLSVLGGDRVSQGWRYRALLAAGALFVLPVHRLWGLAPWNLPPVPRLGTAALRMAAAAPAAGTGRFLDLAAWLWLGAALALAGWNLWRLARCRRALFAGCVKAGEGPRAVADAEARRLGLRREVDLLVSPAVRSPILVGFFRPTVILTTRELSDEALRLILAHELTHFKRLDLWKKLFFTALKCAHWFNPAVYLLGRDFAYQMETACDERVVSRFSPFERKTYGFLLIDCAPNVRNEAAVAFVAFAAGRKRLERRIRTMLHSNKRGRRIFGVALTLALLVGCLTVTALAAGGEKIIDLTNSAPVVTIRMSDGSTIESGTVTLTGEEQEGGTCTVWYETPDGASYEGTVEYTTGSFEDLGDSPVTFEITGGDAELTGTYAYEFPVTIQEMAK